MDERIQELRRQAWDYVASCDEHHSKSAIELFTEKFAELIVKECAKFMDENSGYNDSDGCWFPEPEDMLKHFGVEE